MSRFTQLVTVSALVAALGLSTPAHASWVSKAFGGGSVNAVGVDRTETAGTVSFEVGVNCYLKGSTEPVAWAMADNGVVSPFPEGSTLEFVIAAQGSSSPFVFKEVINLEKGTLGPALPVDRGGFVLKVTPEQYKLGVNFINVDAEMGKYKDVVVRFLGIRLWGSWKDGHFRLAIPFAIEKPAAPAVAGNESAVSIGLAQSNASVRPTNPGDILAPPPTPAPLPERTWVNVELIGLTAGGRYTPSWSQDGKAFYAFPDGRGGTINGWYDASQTEYRFSRARTESLWFRVEYFAPGMGRTVAVAFIAAADELTKVKVTVGGGAR